MRSKRLLLWIALYSLTVWALALMFSIELAFSQAHTRARIKRPTPISIAELCESLPPCMDEIGIANLTWVAPTENEDGTPFDDFSHYRLYSAAEGPLKMIADNIPTKSYDYKVPGGGEYFFAVTAVDLAGGESAFSEVVASKFVTGRKRKITKCVKKFLN